MSRARQGVPFFLLLLLLSPALYFLLPISSESSDPSQIDALAPVEVVAEGIKQPWGVVVDQGGEIFVSDRKTGEVLKITEGEVHPLLTHLKNPVGLSFDVKGRLLIVEEKSGLLLRLEPDSTLTILAQGMKNPRWITVAEDETIYLSADGLKAKRKKGDEGLEGEVILRLSPGGELEVFADGFKDLQGLLVHERTIYAAANGLKDKAGRRQGRRQTKDQGAVFQIPIQPDGSPGPISRLTESELKKPFALVLDRLGALYVSVEEIRLKGKAKDAIGKVNSDGTLTRFASKLKNPRGIALDSLGNLYVADGKGNKHGRILRLRAPPPSTFVFPSFTNQDPLILNGKTEPNSRIDAFLNESTSPGTLTTSDGSFTLTLNLLLNSQNSIDLFTTTYNGHGLTSALAESTLIHDNIAPLIVNLQPTDGSVLNNPRPLIRANFSDNLSGVDISRVEIRLDGVNVTSHASITASGFTLDPFNPLSLFPLSEGSHAVSVSISDLAGNSASASATFTVVTRPEITAFSPASGTLGAEVTIQGRGFDPSPGNTVVKFNGVRAIISSITQTTIRSFVPLGASTGRVTVETPRGIGTSAEDFVVLLRQDFSLSVSPAVGLAVQGTSTTYAVRITSTGTDPFTGLTQLTTGPLPGGVTASLTPSTLGPNATGILTLTTTDATTAGFSIVEVRATAQIEGRLVTRTGTVTLAVQAPGQTVLIGEVRDENNRPLAGVSIKLGGTTITDLGATDAGGNFFIPLSVDGSQVFLIDGSTANTATVNYPTVPVTLDIQPGVVNTLGFTPRLHAQPTAKLIPIIPGQETVLTDPELPGFKMTIPAGVQIIGWDGKPNSQFSVTAIPIDRSPLPPLPAGQSSRQIYLFNFGKMGGGIPTGNIAIDTPNDVDGLPGEKVDLYYFNEAPDGTAPNQWEKYGTGTVSSDGAVIITDINPATGLPYGIPRFCCGARRNVPQPPPPRSGGGPSGGHSDSGKTAGEPVDTATGFFYMDKTDIVLPGILPIAITRTYRTNLTNAGPFGLGTSWPYDMFLEPPPNGSPDTLILFTPGNRQDLFARQPDGSFVNAISPALRGAVVTVVGGLRSLRFKDGSLWRFDGAGRLISQADRNGNTITLTRDSQGRVSQISEPSGRQLTLSYTGANLRIDRIQDAIGREVRYGYDGAGRLATVTDAAGGTTSYTYDTANRMVSITDPRDITFLINKYDSAGRVIKQTQADGGIWTFAYTATGEFISQTTVTDPQGQTTTYRFNAAGYLISQTDGLSQITTFERQPGTNLLLSTADPLSRKVTFTYDASGNVTRITDPEGNVRRFEYEPNFNKLTRITDPLGQMTRFEYDASGNLLATVDPIGARTTITYNEFGQPVSTTDPLGNTTTFAYDDFGNLKTIADPLGNKTQRTYDLVSRLIEQADPRGRSARFTYDGLNRITEIVDALNGVTSFGYDGNGNLLTVTDARGNTITHNYDVMDRLETRTDPVGRQEQYQYDQNGNLAHATDRKGQISTFTYDALDRRVGSSFADGTFTEFTYDAGGRLIQASDSQTGLILEDYDVLDRLIRETTPQGVVAYDYDALGRRTQMDVTGQSTVTYSYDAASRLAQVVQGAQAVDLAYDMLGRRTKLTLPNGVATEYTYDTASRLTELIYRNATGILGNLTYQYDAAGNRTQVGGSFARTLLPDPIASATYDAANRQLTFGEKNMTFDANGNLTSISDLPGVTTFTWDAQDQLIGLTGPSMSATFGYDARGRRTLRMVNSQSYTFQYDGRNIVREVSPAGATFHLGGLGLDEVWVRHKDEIADFMIADVLGSPVAFLDPQGMIGTDLTYEPFGRTTRSAATNNPVGFTGREDDGTGLFHYRARYYHPALARYVSEDPLRFRDGLNAYSYVRNSPITGRDPLGLYTIIVHGIGVRKPPQGYSKDLGEVIKATGETVSEVRWNGNLFSGEAASDAFFQLAQLISNAPPGEPINIIGHSWGSVLAANYLAATGTPVDLLVTIGSPLSAVTADPASASVWVNISSVADPISWYSLTSMAEKLVRVGFVGHTGYWTDPVTIKEIVKRIKNQKKARK
ncbi:MAG: IPT/TIG domain-containing protein [Deltaproteobacteria bacterium]|nr:IPT/TIG domain-containing protein [Deltaproteobacteria bacterium]